MEFFIPESYTLEAMTVLENILNDEDSNNRRYYSVVLVYLRRVFMAGTSAISSSSKQNVSVSDVASLAPSQGGHAIAINLDVFFDRDWDDFVSLQRKILKAWREDLNLPWIRLHAGKFIAPGETLDSGFASTSAIGNDGEETDIMTIFYDSVDKSKS